MHVRYYRCFLYSQVKSDINNVSFYQIVYPSFTANRASYCGLILATRSVSYLFWRKERNNSCIFLRWPVVSEWMVSSVGVSVLVRSGWVSGGGQAGVRRKLGERHTVACCSHPPSTLYPRTPATICLCTTPVCGISRSDILIFCYADKLRRLTAIRGFIRSGHSVHFV